MPGALPDGEPVPPDGALGAVALRSVAETPLSIYLHVPYCRTRCGYCDFNTYTFSELAGTPGAGNPGNPDESTSQPGIPKMGSLFEPSPAGSLSPARARTDSAVAAYVDQTLAELSLAQRVLGADAPPVSTIFVGGGTPTLLDPADLGRFVQAVRDRFGLVPDAEVTTEANPDTVDPRRLEELLEAGFTRISLGMQSADEAVLRTLDRVHTPGRAVDAAKWAKAAGFAEVSLDLIYGTPGESLESWRRSIDTALSAEPTHLSAYSLIVEDGTRLAARIRRAEIAAPQEDDLADKYLLVDDILSGAGFRAYEVSNWARTGGHECRHNLAYWRGLNWWGIGPGAHSHIGGTRFWNVKHPRAYGERLNRAVSPAQAREVLDEATRRMERIMLELRLAEGMPRHLLSARAQRRLPDLVARDLLHSTDVRVCLTRAGRLLADGIAADLVE